MHPQRGDWKSPARGHGPKRGWRAIVSFPDQSAGSTFVMGDKSVPFTAAAFRSAIHRIVHRPFNELN
jgi:hypothetical protein